MATPPTMSMNATMPLMIVSLVFNLLSFSKDQYYRSQVKVMLAMIKIMLDYLLEFRKKTASDVSHDSQRCPFGRYRGSKIHCATKVGCSGSSFDLETHLQSREKLRPNH